MHFEFVSMWKIKPSVRYWTRVTARSGSWLLMIPFLLSPNLTLHARVADSDSVSASLYIPVASDNIGEIRYAAKRRSYKVKGSGGTAPALVLAVGHIGYGAYETLLYLEILTALTEQPSPANSEFWGTSGSGDFLAGAQFSSGWAYSPTSHQSSKARTGLPPMTLHDRLVEQIARRFAGCGPVRVFWLSNYFGWLDARASLEYHFSPIEKQFELIGDAGFTLFPIVLARDGKPSTAQRQARHSQWGTWTLGGKPRTSVGSTGRTLVEWMRESERGSVIEVDLPAKKYDRRGFPAKLEVLDRTGRVVYSRLLVVGGTMVPNCGVGDQYFSGGLYRLVPMLRFQRYELTGRCHGVEAQQGKVYVRLAGVNPPCQDCETEVEFVASYLGADVPRLGSRGGTVHYEQRGTEACIGPAEIGIGAQLSLYSAEFSWLASIEVR